MLPLTHEEEIKHKEARKCFICKKVFKNTADKNMRKVRDHCHYTGLYRGAAHSQM